jgi:hypothetical protein
VDPDSDGLSDGQEFENATHPRSSDTDGDGMTDLWELTGPAPSDPCGVEGTPPNLSDLQVSTEEEWEWRRVGVGPLVVPLHVCTRNELNVMKMAVYNSPRMAAENSSPLRTLTPPSPGVTKGLDRNGGVTRHEIHVQAGNAHLADGEAHGACQEDRQHSRQGGRRPTQAQVQEEDPDGGGPASFCLQMFAFIMQTLYRMFAFV